MDSTVFFLLTDWLTIPDLIVFRCVCKSIVNELDKEDVIRHLMLRIDVEFEIGVLHSFREIVAANNYSVLRSVNMKEVNRLVAMLSVNFRDGWVSNGCQWYQTNEPHYEGFFWFTCKRAGPICRHHKNILEGSRLLAAINSETVDIRELCKKERIAYVKQTLYMMIPRLNECTLYLKLNNY